MFRSFLLAVGISLCILGGECLVFEKAVLADKSPSASVSSVPSPFANTTLAGTREIVPPEWAPWSLLSAGAVIILYAITISRRVSADKKATSYR